MAQSTRPSDDGGWLEASGLLHIFRTLGLAVHAAKLGISLAAILLTFALGGALDRIWLVRGGVQPTAVEDFIRAQELDRPYETQSGDRGIFSVWREHERRCVLGLLGSSVPGVSVAAGTPVGTYVERHSRARPLRNLASMVYGVWWLSRYHTAYFAFFALGALLIWSCAGGAICRIAAVQFARDEKLTMRQAFAYGREKLFGGFFLAPCIPLIFILITMVVLFLGGMLLRIPILGDVVGGLAFGLAIFGGFVISILLLGLFVGGSLFWPAVAVEGSDAFDAFSRGLSYPLSKPWKAVLYAVIAVVYASICWLFVNLFTFFVLKITRTVVAFGTAPFGWWSRGEEGAAVSKLELLWPLGGPNTLYLPPDWTRLTWYEHFSAVLIGFYVLLVIGLMWSFLASFYFSGSTVIYFLLRRDVDGTDVDDVYIADAEEATEPGPAQPPTPQESERQVSQPQTGIPLPVADDPPADSASSGSVAGDESADSPAPSPSENSSDSPPPSEAPGGNA